MDSFRELMSHFPTGVAVVTTLDPAGYPQGMTCSSLASVCLDPPTLLICVRAGSQTLKAIEGFGRFAVNVLHSGSREAAEAFAGPGRRFENLTWQPSRTGIPLLAEHAVAIAECSVSKTMPVGDHVVVFGEVAELITGSSQAPLLYGLREYSQWTGAAALKS